MSGASRLAAVASGRRRWAAIALAAGALAVAGCGEDDDQPETTNPEVEKTTTTAPDTTGTGTGTATGTTTTPGGSGGLSPGDQERDTEGNDIPPPPGSAAERFEERCEKNPESCS